MNKRTIGAALVAGLLLAAAPAFAGWDEGVAAFKSKNYTQAAKEFQEIVQQKPEWPAGHFMLGQALGKLNRDDEALGHLRKAYDLNPNDLSYQMALGKSYLDNQRYADAASLLAKIDANALPSSQRTVYHQMLAAAYDKSGQGDRALNSLKKIADSQPNDGDAQYRYGLAAYNANQMTTAVTALEKAVRLDPSDNQKKETLVKILIRGAREANGNEKKARYQKAVTIAGQLASAAPTYENLLTLGEVQLGAQAYSSAAGSFRQALSKNSSDWLAHFYLGQALTSSQAYSEAVAALNQALTKTSSATDERKVWRQIGFANEKLKNYSASLDAYRKAGDSAAVTRVEENQQIAQDNQQIEAENRKIEEMEAERRRLEEELKSLPGGRPPR
jgi:tetratricopeptide (TPR) repeat protein